MAALTGKLRTADAIALTETEVFLICARDLLPILTAHPQTLIELVQMLCEKLRGASAIIGRQLTRYAAPHRKRPLETRLATWPNEQRRHPREPQGVAK